MARSGTDDDHQESRDRVAVVSVAQRDDAFVLAVAGATVVVVGRDAEAVGALVRTLVDAGHRAAAFVGDAADDAVALAEMVAELFPERLPGEPEPA